MDKLLNIIEIIEGIYVLNNDLLRSTLTLAQNCDNIALISIVGPKSHGKTFFINCLINYMCSEHKDKWPHSEDTFIKTYYRPQSCSKNITPVIKLTSSPFIITDEIDNEVIRTAVFLMDSDFVFDTEMSSQQVQDIIALFLLTSSTVIYNHKQNLPLQEFLRLETMCYRISHSDNSLDSLKSILFLIRDWSPAKGNNKFSFGLYEGSKYIKNFIESMHLNKSYEDLNCFLMSAPELESQTEVIKLSELNKQFLLDLKNLIGFKLLNMDEMLKKRKPNTNEYINANELFELFENCVEKCNQNIDNNLFVDNSSAGIGNLIIESRSRDETDLCKNKTDSKMNALDSEFVNRLNPTSASHLNDLNLKIEKLEAFKDKCINQTGISNTCNIDLIHTTHDNESKIERNPCSSSSESSEEMSTDFQRDESIIVLDTSQEDSISEDEFIYIHEETHDSSNAHMSEHMSMSSEESNKNYNLMTGVKKDLLDYFTKQMEESDRIHPNECQSLPKNCKLSQPLERKHYNTGNGRYNEEFRESKFIARGNYGIVCKATDKKYNKNFAIKKVPINKLSKEKAQKEAEIWSKLESKFIVGLKSIWIEDNYLKADDFENRNIKRNSFHEHFVINKPLLLHIQMEFCLMTLKRGMKKLNKKLNQKTSEVMTTFGYSIASELFIEILRGIDYLHKQNVIHRDLKPSNILISDGKNGSFIKIADFGLATIHEFDGQSHTKYKGTIRYAAPEVMRSRKYDTKADIYSLGVVFLELFNTDINTPTGKNTNLEIKYSTIFKITERMLAPKTSRRPNCEKILAIQSSWALCLNEIHLNEIPIKYKSAKYSKNFKQFILNSLLFTNEQLNDIGIVRALSEVIE